MADIFSMVIEKLQSIGAFNFLFPFMLTSAIFYGLLRKSQVFGEPKQAISVNGVVALVASFMVWAYPILTGVDIETQLATFFTQGLIVTLVFMIGLMIAGMFFPPDLPTQIEGFIKNNWIGAVLLIALIVGVLVFITSGLLGLIISPVFDIGIPTDIILTVVVLIILLLPLLFMVMGERGSPSSPRPEETEKGQG